MLVAAQTDIMTLLADDLKEVLKRLDKAPDVSRMGMFQCDASSEQHWSKQAGARGRTTMVDYCAAY